MRHRNKNNSLGRTASHRKAMFANMATSLILHKRISTTLAKAKELRKFIEPIITRSKVDSTHNRRICFSYLKDKKGVAELFRDISPKIAERNGGYTRILKINNRPGDNAEMCIIELVDYNQVMLDAKTETKAAKTSTRRRRPAAKKKSDEAPKETTKKTEVAAEVTETPTDAVAPEVDTTTPETDSEKE